MRIGVAVLLLVTGLPAMASSQAVESVRLTVDNDNFNLWTPPDRRPDHEYTAGAQLEIGVRRVSSWQRRMFGGRDACSPDTPRETPCVSSTWALVHQIFTPRTNSSDLILSERPHAGWLAAAVTTDRSSVGRRDSLRIEIGVTGRPSLAEPVQKLIHAIGGFWEPLGWDHQLRFEPAIVVEYRTMGRRAVYRGGWSAETIGVIGGGVGNLRTGLEPEVQVRAGYGARHPWRRANDDRGGFSATFVGGVSGAWVLHNMFLDGTLIRSGHQVDRKALVGSYRVGVDVGYRNLLIGLHVHTRSREYATEPAGHTYTSASISFRR